MADDSINWPPLDAVYDDEFGTVETGIYGAAGALWPAARQFARNKLGDEAAGLPLMIKAAALVSRRQLEHDSNIEEPAAYLMKTFMRLVLHELKKRNRRRKLTDERQQDLLPRAEETAQSLDDKILIEQIYARMDEWMKKAFELRMLEYSYEEMAVVLGMKANLIRSKYSKELERLRRQIEEESHQAEQRARSRRSF